MRCVSQEHRRTGRCGVFSIATWVDWFWAAQGRLLTKKRKEREKREKDERKKETERKRKKRRGEREEDLRPICAGYSVFRLCTSLYTRPLTLTVHSPTKSNKGKWRKCTKSDYVIEAGLIWERNGCPGSDTRVACHGWTVHCGAGGPRLETQGEPPFFWPLPFRGDRLETKKGARELGLILQLGNRPQVGLHITDIGP